MELIVLLLIGLLLWLFVGPVIAIAKVNALRRRVEELERRQHERAQRAPRAASVPEPPNVVENLAAAKLPAPALTKPEAEFVPSATAAPAASKPEPEAAVIPPSLPPPLPIATPEESKEQRFATAGTPEQPERGAYLESAAAAPVAGGFSWEQFVGVKLFAWIGGLALFFGIVFFVKYAFERDLVPPALRVAVGYVTAAALMAAGYWFRQRRAYKVLTQTLSATGILAFYGVTYAAHAWYHFPAFTTGFTFLLMAVITAAAFITAVRARAEVVAVLGLAGGFLTPALVSSGQDQPVILFSYIALLNLGLAALAWRQGWWRLLPLGAIGTVLVEWGWRLRFFDSGGYAEGARTWGMIAVFGGFALLFAVLAVCSQRHANKEEEPWWAALLASASALLLAFDFLSHEIICVRPIALYTLVLMASTGWLAAGWRAERLWLWLASLAGSLAVMLHLGLWMSQWLTPELLPHALCINLLFGLLHLGFITKLVQRGVPMDGVAPGAVSLLMMIVMGLPLVLLERVSWMLWPPFLLAGLLTLVIAAFHRKAWIGLLALAVAVTALLHWLVSLRGVEDALLSFLIVLGMTTLVFAAGAAVLRRVLSDRDDAGADDTTDLLRWVQLAALSAPYLLLATVPSLLKAEFGQPALLLSATLILSLAAVWLSRKTPWLTLTAWLGWTLVSLCVCPSAQGMMLWQTAVPALALALLWLMRKSYAQSVAPHAAVGLMMTGSLWILHGRVTLLWPKWLHWVLPAAFALGWIAMTRRLIADSAALAQRSWAGGLALWFITLIFPFQFDYEWLTIAWALEGAALCWLFTRLPHDGLRLTGFGLAAVVFYRLALMGTVLDYHTIPLGLPMWAWLLLSFGLCGTAMLAAASWLKPPHHRWRELPLRALLYVFGGILLFALLNLEIANAFMPAGRDHLTIDFGGNFARDMSYSIAWGLFALALLVTGFWKQAAGARYAGVGLLLITLGKLFLHDLDQVGSIYRIGAFLVVAVIALGASFLYQRAGKKAGE